MPKALRVLIVEDNPTSREVLATMLRMLGHQVVGETASLADTLKELKARQPDLIALDLTLSQENGLELFEAIRRADDGVKVMIVTGNSQKKIWQKLSAGGASALLVKPFRFEELASAIASIYPS